MNQSLLTAHGAQPPKPSRYKPIWTDRFFTGFFTNRSPFRSPLSTFYADGWNLGKTDTIIDGQNIELSPRLTLIRRPGTTAFNPTATIPSAPQGLYSFHAEDGNIHVVADTPTNIYTISPSSLTSIFSKQAGAGQARFCGIGTTLYWGDGVTVGAYNFADGIQRNMGISAPTTAPTMTISGANGASNSFSAVQLNGSSTEYISTSKSITLGNQATIEAWIQTTGTNQIIASFESSQTGTSANGGALLRIDSNGYAVFSIWDSVANAWVHTIASTTAINDGHWHQVSVTYQYTSNRYNTYPVVKGLPAWNNQSGVSPFAPDPSFNASYLYTNSPTVSYSHSGSNLEVQLYVDGTSAVSRAVNNFGIPGNTTGYWRFGQCSFTQGGISPANFNGKLAYIAWSPSIIGAQAGRFAAIQQGTNFTTTESNAGFTSIWPLNESSGTTAADSNGHNNGTYQGTPALAQSAALSYVSYASSTAYTVGQTVVDSNGNVEQCITAGTTGTTPTWNLNLGQNTSDGSVVWLNQGPAALVLSSKQGTRYCYCYVNQYGHFSTASPFTAYTGPLTGAKVLLRGFNAPSDVNFIAIFRCADGGSTPFYVGSVPVNSVNNPVAGAWYYVDAEPDTSLNVLIAAPIAHANDAPPSGLVNLVYHMGRMWGSVGGTIYASGGPDTLVGDGNEAWPPANSWVLPAQIIRLVPTATGLFVFTTSGVYMMAGGPSISQFYIQQMLAKVGVASYNAIDYSATRIIAFTSDRQLLSIDSSVGLVDLGFPIADKLALLNPSNVYVTEHHSGLDNAIYLSDGQTGWYRCSPQQPPDFQITGPVWSPKATINGGFCGAIASLETSPGQYQLLIGSSASNGYVSVRDSGYSVFTDLGAAFEAFFTCGSIVLASPGELAQLGFITCDFNKVGSQPGVSVLMNEIAGSFSSISGFSVSDPPQLYGLTGAPSSLYSNRYYFRQTVAGQAPPPAFCRHMQIKIDFGSDTVMNEIYSITIFGAILVEASA